MLALFVTAVTDKRPLDQVQSSDSAAISLIILYNSFRMTRSLRWQVACKCGELLNNRGPKRVNYPCTRSWAQAIYNQETAAHGLTWTSRRHDREQAVMLFGSRLDSAELEIAGPPVPLMEDSIAILPVIRLATRIGATLVD